MSEQWVYWLRCGTGTAEYTVGFYDSLDAAKAASPGDKDFSGDEPGESWTNGDSSCIIEKVEVKS